MGAGSWGLAVLVAVTAGCGKTKKVPKPALPSGPTKEAIAVADRVRSHLTPDDLATEARRTPETLNPASKLVFHTPSATLRCGTDVAFVTYLAGIDAMAIGFATDATQDVAIRSITLGKKRAWTADAPFDRGVGLLVADEKPAEERAPNGAVNLFDVSKILGADKDVAMDLSATAQVANVKGSQYVWGAHAYRGWHVALHVVSPAMSKEITDHSGAALAAGARVAVLDAQRADVDTLRPYETADMKAVVAKFDQLDADAKQAFAAIPPMPYPQYAKPIALTCIAKK